MVTLCAAMDSEGNLRGRPLAACPDTNPNDGETRRFYSLVTQPETGEVAVVDMGTCSDAGPCTARVLDLEVTQPGSNFLPVGGEPVAIAATPGGMASFVAIAEPGKYGVFALPTSCVGPRPSKALFRDLTTWPACRLPAAPGVMQVVVDATREGSCSEPEASSTGGSDSTGGSEECPADLREEGLTPGRRLLAVALPSLGQIAFIDAQALLDRPQGSFDACPVEATLDLQVELPDQPAFQALPEALSAAPSSCLPAGLPHETPSQSFAPHPSDFALSDGKLYVSDFDAPVVHVVDVDDPCNPRELLPLLPQSFTDPNATVTTRRVAASPLTPMGKQYVYAIDDTPGSAGSIMVFDVSRDSVQRTPLIRPRSTQLPQEAPDRIQFDQEAVDVELVVHDFPATDPETGIAVGGVMCEPDPDESNSRGALYRPQEDGEGAGPSQLRGAFAFVALYSGFVVTVDIEDLDAPCRRPETVNQSSQPNRFGCFNDPYDEPLAVNGSPTVTNELSCNVFEPHRARSARFYDAEAGGSAPSLRSFPQLRDRTGTSLSVDQSATGRSHPRLLAVNREADDDQASDAVVYIGGTLYDSDPVQSELGAASLLVIDPARSERNSLALPFAEPRAYAAAGEVVTATYEGAIRNLGDGLFELEEVQDLDLPPELELSHSQYAVVQRGPNAQYCSSGIEDRTLIKDRAAQMLNEPTPEELDTFGAQYADYVDITSELLPEDDRYWRSDRGSSCGSGLGDENEVTGRLLCELVFGNPRLPNITREFRVERAFNDRLLVEPRRYQSESERRNILELAECCFPQEISYRVRASQQWVVRSSSGIAHDVGTDPETLLCIRDCNPLIAGRNSRVFEVSCEGSCDVEGETERVIGPPEFEDNERSVGPSRVCVLDEHPTGGIQPGAPGSECIYDSLTARFAIYRGLLPSERDMQFSWRVLGGFAPLSVDLLRVADLQTSSSPERLTYVPGANRLLVADGGSTGLVLIGLRREDGGPGFSGIVAF